MTPSEKTPNTTSELPVLSDLPAVGEQLTISDQPKERFLGASNAHMSPMRMAQMKANVESGLNPGGFGRLPGVEQVPVDPIDLTTPAEEAEEKQIESTDNPNLITGVPDHLNVSDEDKWVPPARSSDITPN